MRSTGKIAPSKIGIVIVAMLLAGVSIQAIYFPEEMPVTPPAQPVPPLEVIKPSEPVKILPPPSNLVIEDGPQLTPSSTAVYTVQEGYLGALTEEDLDEVTRHASQGDQAAVLGVIFENRAIILKPGTKVHIVQCGGFACSTVKIRPVGKTVAFWTAAEAIN